MGPALALTAALAAQALYASGGAWFPACGACVYDAAEGPMSGPQEIPVSIAPFSKEMAVFLEI